MARRHYNLPSLTALAAFEAAARHLSFKKAAGELNVTPGAVSRQIKALEADVGQPLFQRIHRGVRLTAPGETLFGTLNTSFRDIAETVSQMRAEDESAVTIATTIAFASMWLMPRLGDFWRSHMDITVNHVISDNAEELQLANADLNLRYGNGNWPGERAERLFGDEIYPVCAPEFAQTITSGAIEDLAALPLLQLDAQDPTWLDWTDWFGLAGEQIRPKRIRSFTSYVIVLQAAQDNQGVALGWEQLVTPMVEQGRLVRLGDRSVTAPQSHYVTWPANREPDPATVALRDWLIAQSADAND